MDEGNMIGDEEVMKMMMVMTMATISPLWRPETSSRLALPRKSRGGGGSSTEMKMRYIVLGFLHRE